MDEYGTHVAGLPQDIVEEISGSAAEGSSAKGTAGFRRAGICVKLGGPQGPAERELRILTVACRDPLDPDDLCSLQSFRSRCNVCQSQTASKAQPRSQGSTAASRSLARRESAVHARVIWIVPRRDARVILEQRQGGRVRTAEAKLSPGIH